MTFTLELTLVLVVLVIFLFLRNLSATIIPSLALPMSIIGTFSVMYLLDYSLDNLSLMALTLAVGFVVDDAIVMLENIVRHLEMGKPRMQAALDGAGEVGFTILSMTFSLAAVFIPVLFMGGIIGKLFHEFAVTIGVAILVSGFVSLTLTPMLCSRFLRSSHGKQQGKFYRATERIYERWLHGYERSLAWVMERRRATLVFSLVILVLTGVLFVIAPKGPLPHRRHRPAPRDHRGGRGRVVRRAHRGSAAHRRRDRQGSRRALGDVGGGHDRGGQSGPAHDRPQAARRAQAQRRSDRARPHAKRPVRPGHHRVRPEPAGHLHRRPGLEESLPVHAAERRHRHAQQRRRAARGAAAPVADARQRHERPAHREPAGHRRHRSRAGGPARRLRERRSRTRSTTRSASGRSPPSTPRRTSTGSSWSCCRSSSRTSSRSASSGCAPRRGRSCRSAPSRSSSSASGR